MMAALAIVHVDWGKLEILGGRRLIGSRCLVKGCRRGVGVDL
jgi:hypothetical protein